MTSSIFVLCILAALAVLNAQVHQLASESVMISRPGMLGQEKGKFYFNSAALGVRYEINYNPAGLVTEIQLYDQSQPDGFFTYSNCPSTCTVTTRDNSLTLPRFYLEASDSCASSTISTRYGNCYVCTKNVANQEVKSLCVADKSDIGTIKRATLTDGTTIEFESATKTAATSKFVVPDAWNCELKCSSLLDVMLVLDESGSISGDYEKGVASGEWASVRSFASKFYDNFEVGPNAVHFGVVQFGNGARYVIGSPHITSNDATGQSVIDALAKCTASGCQSSTHIPRGGFLAKNVLADVSGSRALRKDVGKVIVILTDGYDYSGDPVNLGGTNYANPSAVKTLLEQTATIVTVGVGSSFNPTYLKKLASADPVTGEPLFFEAATFSDLSQQDLIRKLGKAVCSATDSPSKCVGCKGSCICDTCVCPNTCDSGNDCVEGRCTASYNTYGGCKFTDVKCTGDACNLPKCNPNGGCYTEPVVCDDGDPCTNDFCDPVGGCYTEPVQCMDPNVPCNHSTCDPQTGSCTAVVDICANPNSCTDAVCVTVGTAVDCDYIPKTCDDGNLCTIDSCDLSITPDGCVNTPKNCTNDNMCTAGTCNPADGKCEYTTVNCDDNNICTVDTCDPDTGCNHTRVDEGDFCNDNNACTVDICDDVLGCTHEPVVCPDLYNDGCIEVYCDNTTGCGYREKTCEVSGDARYVECHVGLCSNGTCTDSKLNDCINDDLIVAVAVGGGLSALVIGLIIAGIAAVVCGGAVGGTVAYIKIAKPDFGNANPLYKPETQVNQSPLYQGNN